jgi:hypothetical protein
MVPGVRRNKQISIELLFFFSVIFSIQLTQENKTAHIHLE